MTESGDELIPLNLNADISGSFVDVLHLMMAEFNFTVDLFCRKDHKFGSLKKDTGIWNGMVSNLVKGEGKNDAVLNILVLIGHSYLGDMIVAGLTVSLDRALAVSFVTPMEAGAKAAFIKRTEKVPLFKP